MTDLLDFIGEEPLSIQERFERFHARHPEVLAKLVELARSVKAAGMKRCGISLLWERARWFWAFESHEEHKLNNVYRSRYVRLMQTTYPDEFEGFFETRTLTSE